MDESETFFVAPVVDVGAGAVASASAFDEAPFDPWTADDHLIHASAVRQGHRFDDDDHESAEPGWLSAEVVEAFGPHGALARADARFRPRDMQLDMARAVADTLERRHVLVAEAGTGVGKTYAYLVPLLLSGLRCLVSTATKSLQDQLYARDLPRLQAALGVPVRVALLKGRGSYLCDHRLELARHTAELPDRFAVRTLARIEAWALTTDSGDLADVDGLDERSPVIPLVTSTRDNCLGSECNHFRSCHVLRARREAMQADLVVINHHLFFADLALRDTGMAELLPSVDAVVFDEAHQLSEVGVQFLGRTLATGQVLDFSRDLLAAGLSQARGLRPWQEIASTCELAARDLRLVCAGPLRGAVRLRWQERAGRPEFDDAVEKVAHACEAAAGALSDVAQSSPDLAKLQERALDLMKRSLSFLEGTTPGQVRWIDLSAHQARLTESPLEIRETMREQVESAARAWVFTSATLGDDADLSWFTRSAGIEDARVLKAGSPFNYADHARLYVPDRLPRPNAPGHAEAVADLAARCVQQLGGRTFVLTTTLRSLQTIGARLEDTLATAHSPVQVLVQGRGPKRALLTQFMNSPSAVLVGSQSFWEGIDVPGSALQCVLIDKLPFPPPNDPLVEARCKSLEEEGQDAFRDYSLPEAAVALKQGAGRLIRSETDRGLLVICDARLATMPYGKRLIGALPPMTRLFDEAAVMDWLGELAEANAQQVR